MNQDETELERFARSLIEQVRDQTIRDADAMLNGELGGVIGERWRQVLEQPCRQAVHDLIPEIVDRTISTLLGEVDNDELPLAWQTRAGECAALSDLSPDALMGWYLGGGWREDYARERFFNPFEDADDEPDV